MEQSEKSGTGPSGRGHLSHPTAAERYESAGAPRSTVARKAKQLGLKRPRSESLPSRCERLGTSWRKETGKGARPVERPAKAGGPARHSRKATPVGVPPWRKKQRARVFSEAEERKPNEVTSPKSQWSGVAGGGCERGSATPNLEEHGSDSWQQRAAGWEEARTSVGTCSGPAVTRLQMPPRRGWLGNLPAKGPLPQDGVYIGRSHGPFHQPQGWGNPFKADPGKGTQGLQEVVDAYEQHLVQSQFLVDRLPELSEKILYCHCKPSVPCHADALVRVWMQNVDGPHKNLAPGVSHKPKGSLARLVEGDKLTLVGVGFEAKYMVEMDLQRIVSVLRSVPMAALDHLRGGEDLKCILPLPQPASLSEAEITLRDLFETAQDLNRVQHLWKEAGQKVWEWLVVAGVNYMYLRDSQNTPKERAQSLRPAQQAAMGKIEQYVSWFLNNDHKAGVDWATTLKRIRLDYQGEEVKMPHCISWSAIEPALPKLGQVGLLRATDICEGWLGEVMRDPHKALLPRDQWPTAKVWVESDSEWENIVRNCAERQLWGFITPDELVWHNSQPLWVGAFGVPKPERKMSKSGSPVLRLIMNAIPVNAVQSLIHGDIRSLTYHGQFHAMEILDGDLLVTMSIEDLTSAFNLIKLGDPWMPFQALGKPVPGALALPHRPEIAHLPWVYPASRVPMMGSKIACGIMQYIHRRILNMRVPLGASFPDEGQMLKDRPFPAWHTQNGKQDYGRIVSMYLDGFTEFEFKHWDELVTGSGGELQAAMQEAYTQWNVPRQEAKALSRQVAVEDLGGHIDGVFGTVSTPRQFDVDLGAATLWLLSQHRPQHKDLQIIAGRWSRKFQYRREASSVFHVVWFALGDSSLHMPPGAAFPEDLAGELVHALMLMPLMIIDLRLPTSGTVIATDASEHGVGLTAAGKLEAKRLETQRAQFCDNSVGLIDMLGGLSSWRAAFDEMGIQPAAFAFVGGKTASNRVVTAAWPDVFVLDSPSNVTPHWLRQVMDYAPSITHWCLGKRCLEPSDVHDVTHLRNLVLQHTPSVEVSFLVTAPLEFPHDAVKAISQHLKTWPRLASPSVLSDMCHTMFVWCLGTSSKLTTKQRNMDRTQ